MLPGGPTLWVELKAPGKRCSPAQVREHNKMRAMGQHVFVVDSVFGVNDLFTFAKVHA
jgi:hypothetical protein